MTKRRRRDVLLNSLISQATINTMRYILLLLFVLSVTRAESSSNINGRCDRSYSGQDSDQQVHLIESKADIYFGALLNVHQQGKSGFFGCGNISTDGLIAFEALNWIISILNQDSGMINGKKVVESFIPGVKIGMYMRLFHSIELDGQ